MNEKPMNAINQIFMYLFQHSVYEMYLYMYGITVVCKQSYSWRKQPDEYTCLKKDNLNAGMSITKHDKSLICTVTVGTCD